MGQGWRTENVQEEKKSIPRIAFLILYNCHSISAKKKGTTTLTEYHRIYHNRSHYARGNLPHRHAKPPQS
jgi:hypothetical protein